MPALALLVVCRPLLSRRDVPTFLGGAMLACMAALSRLSSMAHVGGASSTHTSTKFSGHETLVAACLLLSASFSATAALLLLHRAVSHFRLLPFDTGSTQTAARTPQPKEHAATVTTLERRPRTAAIWAAVFGAALFYECDAAPSGSPTGAGVKAAACTLVWIAPAITVLTFTGATLASWADTWAFVAGTLWQVAADRWVRLQWS